ncbi:hypothetical protein KBI33_01790 [Candidatus Shapirobacteria bacterium]|nr:hypothetical protein [Candidatus Shapirobacteria bacterium]
MSKQKLIIIVLVTFLVAGGGGFFAGKKYQQSRWPKAAFGQRERFSGQMGNPGGAGKQGNPSLGVRPLSGKVISQDEKGFTVGLPDGGSKIVLLSENTLFKRVENAAKDDLAVGSQVMILGQENSDGSISAQSVQIENAAVEEKK